MNENTREDVVVAEIVTADEVEVINVDAAAVTQAAEAEVTEVVTEAETIDEVETVIEAVVVGDEPADVDAPVVDVADAPAKATVRKSSFVMNSGITKLKGMVGTENDMIVAEMPGANQRAEIVKMKEAIKNKDVLYGKVVGVEVTTDSVNIIIKRDTLRVIIPAFDFFAYSDMNGIEQDTKENKLIRYRRKASHMFNAVVCFMPMGMSENEGGVPFVAASRKFAMDKLREQHFFGPSADVEIGSMTTASIISTGPRYITVERLGLECVIGTGNLSAFTFIEDASQEFHPGEGIVVAVEKLAIDKEKRKIDIELSHALVERLEAKVETASEKMLRGRYLAKVAAETPNYYVVIIQGLKIRGLVPKSGGYRGDTPLLVGDDVVLLVGRVIEERNLVLGNCIKAN